MARSKRNARKRPPPYKVGDRVYAHLGHGMHHLGTVVEVEKQHVMVELDDGERWRKHKSQVQRVETKSNPGRSSHARLAKQELEVAEQALSRAENHGAKDAFGRALQDAVLAVSYASVAAAEAQHGRDSRLAMQAEKLVRQGGNLILVSVAGIERTVADSDGFGAAKALANPTARNQRQARGPRQPDVTPLFLIRTYSSSLLTGSGEIYLVINTQGEVMDAIITDSEDFGPVEDEGYGNLSILELDVSGSQYRKLKKLGRRLAEVSRTRPTFRPGQRRAGPPIVRPPGAPMKPATANPNKKRLMR